MLLIVQLAGCYSYVPVSSSAVPPGSRIAVAVTDRGRVGLSEPVGPGVRRIEGDFLAETDTSVMLSVSSVQFLDLGMPARWSGERLEISRGFISEIREWRLSRTRTWITLGLVAVGAIAASFVAIGGFGADDPSDRPPGGGPEPD